MMTNGCGVVIENSVSMSGEQNSNRSKSGNANTAEATHDQNMPRADATEAFLVSSAMWPDASHPVRTPEVERNASMKAQTFELEPVPFSYCVKTHLALWNPYVLETPIGSQTTVKRRSSAMMIADALKIQANLRGEIRLDAIAMIRKTSETAHCTARNLMLDGSSPPGNALLKTVNSDRI